MAAMEVSAERVAVSGSRVVRWLYLAAGGLLVAIGVLGIFLPLLPTTIFFILAAGCFGKSSPGAYRWLHSNRYFGKYLRDYRERRGATVGTKAASIGSLWLGIGAAIFFVHVTWIALILLVIAAAVSVHLLRLTTLRD
ncbi:MAG: DUF454 domain-containing protein [Anaerolinea sp.]|nr:DUF454 domain-containing protein [Anaerolinea sp.]